jgi:3-oxoacyl-[acyl-carrier protein] reductase
MDLGLKDKVVMVAGGSYGIGYSASLLLAQEGARVAIMARNAEKLAIAAQTIEQQTGCSLFTFNGDVTDADNCRQFVQQAYQHYGQLDGLIVAAGASEHGKLMSVQEHNWNHNWRLNVLGPFHFIQEAVPLLKKSEHPAIVIIGSASAKQPTDNQLVSNVTKAGVLSLVKTAANELAEFNIRVNNVCPGRIMSERRKQKMIDEATHQNIQLDQLYETVAETIPMKRLGTTDEVAALAVFLISKCGSYITGQSINVDGGLVKSII